MRRNLYFIGLCAQEALSGRARPADDSHWTMTIASCQAIGAAAGVGLGAFLALYFYSRGAPVMSRETAIRVALGGAAGFVVAWLVAFSLRFLQAPATLYFREKELAERLKTEIDGVSQGIRVMQAQLEIVSAIRLHTLQLERQRRSAPGDRLRDGGDGAEL